MEKTLQIQPISLFQFNGFKSNKHKSRMSLHVPVTQIQQWSTFHCCVIIARIYLLILLVYFRANLTSFHLPINTSMSISNITVTPNKMNSCSLICSSTYLVCVHSPPRPQNGFLQKVSLKAGGKVRALPLGYISQVSIMVLSSFFPFCNAIYWRTWVWN